ncbi:MAG: hypothetical protein ACKOXO_00490 [Cyanobium sp.]
MRRLRRPFSSDPTSGVASVSVRRHRRLWPSRVAAAGLALAAWLADPAIGRAASPSPSQLQALEAVLNGQDSGALRALLAEGPGLDVALLQRRWSALRQAFPDARWQLSAGSPTASGRPTVNLRVSGTRREGSALFRLSADQWLELSSNGERISGQTLLREQTILRSGESNLPVSVLIPDAVLTGQRYDVDVIFDEPLDGALVVGGIQSLTPQQLASLESPAMDVVPLGGGGVFRTVRAPFTPGSQTWAVLLVHPRGVVSTTKRVRVVSDRAQLTP